MWAELGHNVEYPMSHCDSARHTNGADRCKFCIFCPPSGTITGLQKLLDASRAQREVPNDSPGQTVNRGGTQQNSGIAHYPPNEPISSRQRGSDLKGGRTCRCKL